MAIQTAIDSINNSSGSPFGFKNRIINGAMVIDQRNAGASVTPTNGLFTLDRWRFFVSQSSKLTTQQNQGSVTPPAGFAKYLGITSSSAYSVGASDNFNLMTSFESSNVYDFAWGTASAATVTLSFWVRSSLTGTFGGAVRNWAYTRSYPFNYTISSANTWEYKTVTISGDTAGTWNMSGDNAGAIEVLWGLGVGSTYSGTAGSWAGANYLSATGATSVVGTNGATFYITGVQLEKGSAASAFDYRDYGRELAMCQRYYQQVGGNTGDLNSIALRSYTTSGSYVGNQYMFPVQMRTSPTMTISGTFAVTNCGQPVALGADGKTWSFQTQASATGAMVLYSNNSGLMTFSAEL
jgi:hypothetical protein